MTSRLSGIILAAVASALGVGIVACSSTETAVRPAQDFEINAEIGTFYTEVPPLAAPGGELTMPETRYIYREAPAGPLLRVREVVIDRQTQDQSVSLRYEGQEGLISDTWPLAPFGFKQVIRPSSRDTLLEGRRVETGEAEWDSLSNDVMVSALAQMSIQGEGKEQQVEVIETDSWPWFFFGMQRPLAYFGYAVIILGSGLLALRLSSLSLPIPGI